MEKPRFSMLLLEPGELYFEDFSCTMCVCERAGAGAGAGGSAGRLKLCSKSLVFEPRGGAAPLIKLQYRDTAHIAVVPPAAITGGDNVICVKVKQYAEMLEGNTVVPYTFHYTEKSFYFTFDFSSAEACLSQMQQLHRASTLSAGEHNSMVATISHSRYTRTPFDKVLMEDFSEEVVLELPAERVSPLVRNPGRLALTPTALYFQPFNNIDSSRVQRVKLSALRRLFPRRFLLRQVGLEMYSEGSGEGGEGEEGHLYLVLESEAERAALLARLTASPALRLQRTHPEEMTLQWQNRLVSNYDYLLYLNSLADRSKNDLTQYPVFPWVLADYRSESLDLEDPGVYRDLSRPVGALHPPRLLKLRERYDEMSEPKFLYGSHYSAPALVLFYLVRKYPHYMLCLQNGRFDHPDRMFNSLADTFHNCLHNMSDLTDRVMQVRKYPHYMLCLQNGRFDHPDRMFNSLADTFHNCLHNMSDLTDRVMQVRKYPHYMLCLQNGRFDHPDRMFNSLADTFHNCLHNMSDLTDRVMQVRKYPHYMLCLQNGRFDHPDRMFNSLADTFHNCLHNMSDLTDRVMQVRKYPHYMLCLQNGRFDHPDRMFNSLADTFHNCLHNMSDLTDRVMQVRKYPHYMLCLQNGRFDHPDRMFNSLADTFHNCLHNMSDLTDRVMQVRKYPHYMLCLQNGRFDHPDRMFNSLADTFHNCLHNMSDLTDRVMQVRKYPHYMLCLQNGRFHHPDRMFNSLADTFHNCLHNMSDLTDRVMQVRKYPHYMLCLQNGRFHHPDRMFNSLADAFHKCLHNMSDLTDRVMQVRKYPHYMLCLQNGRFDHPDRMFNSLADAFHNCLHNMSDFKELVPEFYDTESKGDFLQNVHEIDFGERHDGRRVGDVALPAWASSPAQLVRTLRAALESEHVSRHLHLWIDLIFGYKQRGEEAARANNLFHHVCYEGSVELEAVWDMNERHALEVQILEFGQVPRQLFTKPHARRLPAPPRAPLPLLPQPPASREPVSLDLLETIQIHREGATCVQCAEDAVVSTGQDGVLKVWSRTRARQVRSVALAAAPLTCCALLHPHTVAAGSCDNHIYLYNLEFGRLLDSFRAHDDSVSCLLWLPEECVLVSGGLDCVVRVWAELGRGGQALKGLRAELEHEGKVTALAALRRGEVAAGTSDGEVYVWRVASKQLVLRLSEHRAPVRALCFLPYGDRLLSASDDSQLNVTDLTVVHTVYNKKVEESVCAAACDGDRRLWLGGRRGAALQWDLLSFTQECELRAHDGAINSMCWQGGAGVLLTAGEDATVKVWRPAAAAARQP